MKAWHLGACWLVAFLGPLVCDIAFAQAPATAPVGASVPDDATLEGAGAVIGHVSVRVEDVFDPEDPRERRRLYLLANQLHRTTSPAAIAAQLPFRSGDPYSRHLLDEAERILRRTHYLHAASIRAVRWDGHVVDLEVVARDTWTFKAGLSVGRSGGVGHSSFRLQDLDLLGSGKSLTLARTNNVDRSATLVELEDPNVLGSHARLHLGFSDNTDGMTRSLDLGRPFYALETRWALGLRALDDDRVDSLYALGHVADRFRHEERRLELYGGISAGLRAGFASRWTAGLTWERDRFAAADGGGTVPLPAERVLAYPWVAWDRIEDDYARERNLDQLDRVEDLPLGRRLHARLGVSPSVLGASRTEAIVDATAADGWRLGAGQTLLAEGHLTGRLGQGGGSNVLAGGSLRYYRRDFGEQLFFATAELDAAHDLDPERQLLLGGDSGLRGYPLRYQDGDYRFLLTLEQRFFTPWYPLRLMHVGAAVFADVGAAWGGGLAPDLGLLRDLGAGLRLSSGRSGFGSVVHFDLAMPLDGDPSIARLQWLVTTRETF